MNQTKIKLYSGVEFTNQNTILFKTKAEQSAFFDKKVQKVIENRYTVIADQIRVSSEDMDYYELQYINYVSTQRTINMETKTYYYRVEEIIYENDRTTTLILDLDVLQTYMFDYEIKNSTIVRQHENRGSGVKRIFNKNMEPIDVVEYDHLETEFYLDYQQDHPEVYAVIITAKYDRTAGGLTTDQIYGSLPQGFKTFISFIRYDDYKPHGQMGFTIPGDPNRIYNFVSPHILSRMAANPNIYDIYITPYIPSIDYAGLWPQTGQPYINGLKGYKYEDDYIFVDKIKIDGGDNDIGFTTYALMEIRNVKILNEMLKIPNGNVKNFINNVENFNNGLKETKIYGSQYTSIELTSGLDKSTTLHFDEFNGKIDFEFTLGNAIDKTIFAYPINYNIPRKHLMVGSGNSIPMINNAYIEYMNNNKHSIQNRNTSNIVKAVAGIGIGAAATIATGGAAAPAAMAIGASVINAGIGHATAISAENAKLRDLKNQPDKIEAADNVDFNLSNGLVKFKLRIKTPTQNEVKRLEDFFKLYGYTTSKIGRPNIQTRKVFNYITLTDMIITGNVPLVDKESLKQIYGAGVRFWHNENTFLNFDIPNDER